jgi:hypothetical protein
MSTSCVHLGSPDGYSVWGANEQFCTVKEIKHVLGGVAAYVAQASVRIDAEVGEKGRFRMKQVREKSDFLINGDFALALSVRLAVTSLQLLQ